MVAITKAVAVARLGDVPEAKCFWSRDGKCPKNLRELETALRQMPEETFRYHANEAKNDFSQWVQDVIGDDKLARDLRKSPNAAQAARSVASRIAWLESRN